jgi:hypothetical protein
MILSEFHNAFNGVFWRVSEKGIELKDGGLISPDQFSPRPQQSTQPNTQLRARPSEFL